MAHKAKYGTEDPFKNIIACTIFICECYTKQMVPMKMCSLQGLFKLKKFFFILNHLKIRGNPIFRGFLLFFKHVFNFLGSCNSSMSFCRFRQLLLSISWSRSWSYPGPSLACSYYDLVSFLVKTGPGVDTTIKTIILTTTILTITITIILIITITILTITILTITLNGKTNMVN